MQLPPGVLAFADRGPAWADWVASLPGLVGGLLEEWHLGPEGPVWHGHTALALPVRDADGAPGVLKVAFPDDESAHEALALQRWGGRAAVRLLRADPHRRALLLERLERRDLTQEWDVAACETVGALYADLHRPAPPQVRPLAEPLAEWTRRLAALPRDAGLPHRMVEHAVSLGRSLGRHLEETAAQARLLHTDLHYENVLWREPEQRWVAIDPKPLAGDPHYEVAPLLWNRFDEVAGDVRRALRARFHAVVDAAGLDEDRARDWVVVRMLHNALWEIEDALAAGTRPDRGWLTVCLSVAKAVQD